MSMMANLQLIYVSDIQKSTAFYSKLFQLEPVMITPRYVSFAASTHGDALFALWTGGEQPDPNTPRFNEIGLMVSNDYQIQTLYQDLQNNPDIQIHSPLKTEVFGATFVIKDPDGHLIRISPVD
jgi:catechol 2,3-dioxygenase-like lactoylglutathione lyase family enzyme